jgi:hypothetical protein
MELTTENIVRTIALYCTLEEFFDSEVIGKEVYDKLYDEFNDAQKGIIDGFLYDKVAIVEEFKGAFGV